MRTTEKMGWDTNFGKGKSHLTSNKNTPSGCRTGCFEIQNASELTGALDEKGALADAAAKIMKFGAADFATVDDLNFGNARGMDWENALDAFTVGDFPNGEGSVHAGAAAGDDQAFKNLDTLFAAFHHAAMDFHGITDIERGDVLFQLLLLDLINDIHGMLQGKGMRVGPMRNGVFRTGRDS